MAYVPIAERIQHGLLFRIEKCAFEPSTLFGTIHTDEAGLLESMPEVIEALKQSRVALFELKESQELQQEVVRYMIYPPQQRDGLSHAIGLDLYEQALTQMQRLQPDTPPAFFNRYRPWAAAILLQYPPQNGDGIVMDTKLQRLAIAAQIPVEGLETAAEQFSFFQGLPLEEQRLMIADAVTRSDEIRQTNRELFAAYRQRDLATINDIGNASFTAIEDPAFAKKLELFLLINRNKKMISRMLPELKRGHAFVAVGALHLPGNDGLLSRLEEKGFFISQISASGSDSKGAPPPESSHAQ
ncbi:MAG: TraB/GumN family protein [Rickettsiales bacterium]|nr:TraB/GumN family protein [Rickettsiales bacterium]